MVLSWVILAELLQSLQGTSYNNTFFIVYFIHGIGYTIFLILYGIWYFIKGRKVFIKDISTDNEERDTFTKKKLSFICLTLSPLMFICAWTWIESLSRTTVATNTGIYNSSSVFVFIFSVIFLGEKVTILKVFSVIFSISGIVVLSFATTGLTQTNELVNTIPGIIYVIISTICYGLYEVLYKKLAIDPKNPSSISNTIFFLGMKGFWISLFFWPIFLMLNYSGFEKFEFPPIDVIEELLINVSLDTIFNLLLLVGITLTSPLFISIGSILTVPVSIITDKIIHNYSLPNLSWIGIIFIIAGFIGLNVAEFLGHQRRERLS